LTHAELFRSDEEFLRRNEFPEVKGIDTGTLSALWCPKFFVEMSSPRLRGLTHYCEKTRKNSQNQ